MILGVLEMEKCARLTNYRRELSFYTELQDTLDDILSFLYRISVRSLH